MSEKLRLRLILGLSLGTATIIMLGLPLIMLALPNPALRLIPDIDKAGRGVFAQSEGQTWRLFPRSSQIAVPAADTPVLHPDARVVVAVRQPGTAESYRIRRVGGRSQSVRVTLRREGSLTRVTVAPSRLDDGFYELEVPRESMFGGTDFAYFSVSR